MNPFEFICVPRILFGRGQVASLAAVVASLGAQRPLLVHNVTEAVLRRVLEQLPDAPPAVFVQRGEPKVDDVDQALDLARAHQCDSAIGLGGGSAIDTAKAVAGLLGNGGQALDYMEIVGKGLKITRPAAPWIALPTTAGTGAEVARNAVITAAAQGFKASIRSEHLLARVALVDPELGVDVPPQVTASCGMDALCQLIESYCSKGANPMSDALALRGIELASGALAAACHNGHDLEARQDMALAALLSGLTLTSAGLGAVHGFAAPLGARYPAPHGTVCAALLPHVIEANIAALLDQSDHHPVLQRYAAVGRLLARQSQLPTPAALQACVDVTLALLAELDIPPLSRFGIEPAHIPQLIEPARQTSSMKYNPVTLSDQALTAILRRAIGA